MEVFSEERLAEIRKILSTERADPAIYVPAIETDVIKYSLVLEKKLGKGKRKLVRKDNPKQARKDLEELSKRSIEYFRFLKKFRTDTRGYVLTIAESIMREVLPGKINLEDLAKKVFETKYAANCASYYLPSSEGPAEDWRCAVFISRLAEHYTCCTGKGATVYREGPFYHLVQICLDAAGHDIVDPYDQIRRALSKKQAIDALITKKNLG